MILAQVGEALGQKTAINYLFESLWDFRSSENNGVAGEYYSTTAAHSAHWSDEYCNARFGALFFDYVFTMSEETGLRVTELQNVANWDLAREQSAKRIVLPAFSISIPPVLPDLVAKVTKWTSHNYEPYFVEYEPMPSRDRKSTTSDEIETLARYLPTRETILQIGDLDITFTNGQDTG